MLLSAVKARVEVAVERAEEAAAGFRSPSTLTLVKVSLLAWFPAHGGVLGGITGQMPSVCCTSVSTCGVTSGCVSYRVTYVNPGGNSNPPPLLQDSALKLSYHNPIFDSPPCWPFRCFPGGRSSRPGALGLNSGRCHPLPKYGEKVRYVRYFLRLGGSTTRDSYNIP